MSGFSVMRDLREDERMVFAELLKAAEAGAPAPTQDDLAHILGGCSVSTTVKIVQRLEAQGRIRVERFQRGRIVTIPREGRPDVSTAAPKNRTPHWRDLPDRPLPTVPIRRVEESLPDLADFILKEAFACGKTPPDMIQLLLRIGTAEYMAEKKEMRV